MLWWASLVGRVLDSVVIFFCLLVVWHYWACFWAGHFIGSPWVEGIHVVVGIICNNVRSLWHYFYRGLLWVF